MLACKDLNWSTPNAWLYNEAFTGRAKAIPRYQHCLCEDHSSAACPQNPSFPYVGWIPAPYMAPPTSLLTPAAQPPAPRNEICCNFNDNRCQFARCRYIHTCSDCRGPHPAADCPAGPSQLQRGPLPRVARPTVHARHRPCRTQQPASDPPLVDPWTFSFLTVALLSVLICTYVGLSSDRLQQRRRRPSPPLASRIG